jgi:hypothetical protein
LAGVKKTDTWEVLKSGVRKNGDWYACQYVTGWYFVVAVPHDSKGTGYDKTNTTTNFIGPFKTFEEGLKEWKKQ